MVLNQTTVSASAEVKYPLWGTTSHGRCRESAIKLSAPLQKGEYLTSALRGTRPYSLNL